MEKFSNNLRHGFLTTALSCLVVVGIAVATWAGDLRIESARCISITDFGAVGDGRTVNTLCIQAVIDRLATQGGGTVVIPQGVFLSGAIFFKPGVNLRLDQGAVLKCSSDMKNFTAQRTRIEGHFEDHFTPALINASACDGLRITGAGTLDGNGRPI